MWHFRVFSSSLILLGLAFIFSGLASGSATLPSKQRQACVSAQACFESRDLRAVVTQFPNSVWASRAHFLIGTRLIKHGDPAGRSSLEHLPDTLPIVADYIQWALAESFFIEGNFQQAALAYRLVTRHVQDSPLAFRARYFEGLSWYRFGDCESARKLLAAVFGGRPDHTDADSSLRSASGFYLADCYLKSGKSKDAADILWRIWTDMPHLLRDVDTAAAVAAFGKLNVSREHATIKHLWRRASVFFDAGQYAKAVDEFTLYLRIATTQHHLHRVDGQIKLGIALMKTRRLDEARTVFETVIQQSPFKVASEAYLWLAQTYLRLGAGVELQALAQQAATLSLPPSIHVSVLYFLGLWLEDEERVVDARATYQRAMEVVADDDSNVQIQSVLWQLAWLHLRAGNDIEAVQAFNHIIKYPSESGVQRALYWKAIALERMGKAENSRLAFLALCKEFSHGYYCQNARGYRDMPLSGVVRLPGLDISASAERSLDRVQEMIVLGLIADAVIVLRDHVLKQIQYLAVSQQLQSAGAAHQSLRLIKRHFSSVIQGGHDSVPSLFWDLAYPKAYMPVIRDAIAEDSAKAIDPYLIAALIREESVFDANARSKAGALGLMQLIPKTAQQIALSRDVKTFDPGMLLDPQVNIQFGVAYFRSLLQTFDGNLVSSIAGYNAGPIAVARWRTRLANTSWEGGGHVSGEEKFIEAIPYKETRSYVKRVLQTYREYHRVNQTGCKASFLDKHC